MSRHLGRAGVGRMTKSLKNLLTFCLVVAGFTACMWVVAWMVRPPLGERPLPYTSEQIEQAKRDRDVHFDPNHTPSLHRDIKVEPKAEAPVLAELVNEGKLPPLKDRLPLEPAVMEGEEGIGKYGGAWRRLANQPSDIETITYRLAGGSMMRFSPLGNPVVPHIAKSLTSSPDKRVWTVKLREGMRWSDGHPYTTDDVMYYWNCEANNKYVLAAPPAWAILNGKVARVAAIDKYTFTISFDDPCLLMPERLVTRDMCDSPAHYLRPMHPDPAIGDAELCERLMKAYKQPSRTALYVYMHVSQGSWQNSEHPRLWPWIYHTYRPGTPQIFVRNPYYYVVDTAGNQLPYLDRVQFDVQDPKILSLTAANGGASMQDRHIRFSDYTELMSRRESSGTRILHWYPAIRSVWVINPNQNKRVDPDDPSSKWKAQLLSDKRFRQALSVAINR
ncbi:MAG TPA: ABC transporter substrate-binding protein, partial [Tepidisphaeraceae bacterium]